MEKCQNKNLKDIPQISNKISNKQYWEFNSNSPKRNTLNVFNKDIEEEEEEEDSDDESSQEEFYMEIPENLEERTIDKNSPTSISIMTENNEIDDLKTVKKFENDFSKDIENSNSEYIMKNSYIFGQETGKFVSSDTKNSCPTNFDTKSNYDPKSIKSMSGSPVNRKNRFYSFNYNKSNNFQQTSMFPRDILKPRPIKSKKSLIMSFQSCLKSDTNKDKVNLHNDKKSQDHKQKSFKRTKTDGYDYDKY